MSPPSVVSQLAVPTLTPACSAQGWRSLPQWNAIKIQHSLSNSAEFLEWWRRAPRAISKSAIHGSSNVAAWSRTEMRTPGASSHMSQGVAAGDGGSVTGQSNPAALGRVATEQRGTWGPTSTHSRSTGAGRSRAVSRIGPPRNRSESAERHYFFWAHEKNPPLSAM